MALLTRPLVVALLVVAVAGVVAGCYDPTLRDCTLACGGAGDCAAGQVCGDDGLCARPSVAGTCRTLTAPDGNPRPPDVAPALGALHLVIVGPGKVTLTPPGVTCKAPDDHGAACDYTVVVDQPFTLTAIPIKSDHPFHDWASACAGQGPTCTLVAALALTATVTFAKAP